MSRNETFFVRLFGALIFLTPLYGEMTVGLLTSIESNTKQNLLYNNQPISCEPFGILTLEKISSNRSTPQECRSHIENFYKSYSHAKEFAREHLHIQQSYHFEIIKEGCVLYANGVETYSEMLLREGLALIDPAFDQKEWNVRLKRAQQGAQMQKAGLHDTQIEKFCIKEEK
jgi:hypothetical protein